MNLHNFAQVLYTCDIRVNIFKVWELISQCLTKKVQFISKFEITVNFEKQDSLPTDIHSMSRPISNN